MVHMLVEQSYLNQVVLSKQKIDGFWELLNVTCPWPYPVFEPNQIGLSWKTFGQHKNVLNIGSILSNYAPVTSSICFPDYVGTKPSKFLENLFLSKNEKKRSFVDKNERTTNKVYWVWPWQLFWSLPRFFQQRWKIVRLLHSCPHSHSQRVLPHLCHHHLDHLVQKKIKWFCKLLLCTVRKKCLFVEFLSTQFLSTKRQIQKSFVDEQCSTNWSLNHHPIYRSKLVHWQCQFSMCPQTQWTWVSNESLELVL